VCAGFAELNILKLLITGNTKFIKMNDDVIIMMKSKDAAIKELKKECNNCHNDGDCSDCCILEEINEIRASYLHEMMDEDLEFDCENCDAKFCKDCAVTKEIDWRRRVRTGRDVYHNGSKIEGGGVSRPEWMDDDQWGEYRMSAEYASEVSYQGFDEPFDEDYYY